MTLTDDVLAMQNDAATPADGILVVDDEILFGKAVVRHLERAGYHCVHAQTLGLARAALAQNEFALILLDMRLPDGSGLDFLCQLRQESQIPVIVMTAYGEVDDAVTAMKNAASDYLKKPLDLDELLVNVKKVIRANLVRQRLAYSHTRENHNAANSSLLGESDAIVDIRRQIKKMAELIRLSDTPPTVLITGETGSGKDVAARLLHQCSSRCDRPFVHVDCAALPKDLIESELFGHVKGAFTHALQERTGLIEAAEDGVVFLDEIAELPLELQAKLLAVLERRTLRKIGSSHEQRTCAWFIAATNRNVAEMVADGRLRSDLYFRLNVLEIAMPPLRARGNDVLLLARALAADTGRRYGLAETRLSKAAEARLLQYSWPGNVRELNHVIERAVLLSNTGEIEETALTLTQIDGRADVDAGLPGLDGMTLEAVEKMMIERALRVTNGNVSEAARQLGITRMAMRYRLKKYALAADDNDECE